MVFSRTLYIVHNTLWYASSVILVLQHTTMNYDHRERPLDHNYGHALRSMLYHIQLRKIVLFLEILEYIAWRTAYRKFWRVRRLH